MKIKIGINGMGRIGRMIIRSIVENNNQNIINLWNMSVHIVFLYKTLHSALSNADIPLKSTTYKLVYVMWE